MESNGTNIWMVPLQELAADAEALVPKLLAALVVLAFGGLCAWLCRALSLSLLKAFKLDVRLKDLWLFKEWTKGMKGRTPTEAVASFVFYLILFVSVLLTIHMLGVDGGRRILDSLLGVVPKVLSLLLILFLGTLLAMFFSVVAQLVLAGSGAQHPRFWGKVIAWGTFVATIMFSLEPLGMAGRILGVLVFILLGVLGLAAAIAFGLGCKDLAREFMIELLKEDKPD